MSLGRGRSGVLGEVRLLLLPLLMMGPIGIRDKLRDPEQLLGYYPFTSQVKCWFLETLQGEVNPVFPGKVWEG